MLLAGIQHAVAIMEK